MENKKKKNRAKKTQVRNPIQTVPPAGHAAAGDSQNVAAQAQAHITVVTSVGFTSSKIMQHAIQALSSVGEGTDTYNVSMLAALTIVEKAVQQIPEDNRLGLMEGIADCRKLCVDHCNSIKKQIIFIAQQLNDILAAFLNENGSLRQKVDDLQRTIADAHRQLDDQRKQIVELERKSAAQELDIIKLQQQIAVDRVTPFQRDIVYRLREYVSWFDDTAELKNICSFKGEEWADALLGKINELFEPDATSTNRNTYGPMKTSFAKYKDMTYEMLEAALPNAHVPDDTAGSTSKDTIHYMLGQQQQKILELLCKAIELAGYSGREFVFEYEAYNPNTGKMETIRERRKYSDYPLWRHWGHHPSCKWCELQRTADAEVSQ